MGGGVQSRREPFAVPSYCIVGVEKFSLNLYGREGLRGVSLAWSLPMYELCFGDGEGNPQEGCFGFQPVEALLKAADITPI